MIWQGFIYHSQFYLCITRPPNPFGIAFHGFFQDCVAFLVLLGDPLLLSLDAMVEKGALLDEAIPF